MNKKEMIKEIANERNKVFFLIVSFQWDVAVTCQLKVYNDSPHLHG